MERYDFLVVGGGPAGLSAALVAHSNRLKVLLVEQDEALGGQLNEADHPIMDFLGRAADRGDDLARAFAQQAQLQGLPKRLSSHVDGVTRREDGTFLVTLRGGAALSAKAVLIATGVGPRRLGLPEERTYGLLDPPRQPGLEGKRVVVIGGGDEACQTALWLAQHGSTVTLVSRSSLRARPTIAAPLSTTPGITVLAPERVVALEGDGAHLRGVRLSSGALLPAERCFARLGREVRGPSLEPDPIREEEGMIRVDDYGRTSVPGLYAAGDLVVSSDRRYISVATGLGAIVGRAVEADLAALERRPKPLPTPGQDP